jgi:type I restriction enzyme S subunit
MKPFGDLLEVPLRSGINAPSRVRGRGVKLVNMGELFANDRLGDLPMELAPLPGGDRDRHLLRAGDLLFARQSLTLEGAGRCCYVLPAEEERTWEGHIIRARLLESVALSAFYYYWFRSSAGRAATESIVEQVAAAGIRISDLAQLSVPCPPIEEQRSIAEILTALDDKIDSNHRLAGLADQLVRAEVAQAAVSASEGSVSDVVRLVRATVRPDSVAPTTRYIGLEHMPRGRLILDRWGFAGGLGSTKSSFAGGDILFGKLRPYFKKVGLAPPGGGICSTDILVLRPACPEAVPVALAVLGSDEFIDFASNAASGTKMPRASWDHMKTYPAPVLGPLDAARLWEVTGPILQLAQQAMEECLLLAEIRDTLTRKLLDVAALAGLDAGLGN